MRRLVSHHLIATALRRGLRKRCPHCGDGHLFSGWSHHLERCSVCGLVYERNPGDTWAFTIIGDRLPIAAIIAIIYFGVGRSHRVLGLAMLAALGVVLVWTAPNRWGVGIALHYLSRVYWPDPADPIPPPKRWGPPQSRAMIARPSIMISATAEDYAGVMSQRVASESRTLAARWLVRLKEVLTVAANEVFASDQLLDHIPALVEEIASYLNAPTDNEIAANAAVMEKARELGVLRHEQRASVHQLLHEYEILGDILEVFIIDETERLGLQPSVAGCFQVQHRLTRAVRVLMRTTVDTFVAEYTATIQSQTERIQAFNRAASHELRSPIGTLVFAAALLDTEVVRQDPGRMTKVAATVRSSAERLTWLVENLQRIARMGDTIDVPSQQRVDLSMLATEVARQVGDMASARGVTIRVAEGLPTIVADPAQVELILLNIVSNGIKYADAAKPTSFVEIAAAEPPGDDTQSVTIRVRDNGLGIPAADLPTIFDRFFRAHAHLDGELGNAGSGLGLAIVGDCVKALGGTIRCESTVGQGTSFFITLPSSQPGNALTNG